MTESAPVEPIEDTILRSLRRITRAIDLHSRRLAQSWQLTAPQLVCLRALQASGPSTAGSLARGVSLSQATITGIIDRLEARGLVTRARGVTDRRRVMVQLTDEGQALVETAPSPLQDRFAARLRALAPEAQTDLQLALQRIVVMMEAEDLEASPILASGEIDGP